MPKQLMVIKNVLLKPMRNGNDTMIIKEPEKAGKPKQALPPSLQVNEPNGRKVIEV